MKKATLNGSLFCFFGNFAKFVETKHKAMMIQANEVRIGNLLEFSNGIEPSKIITVGRRFFSSASVEKEDGNFQVTPYYKPIKLTEEWLLKAGCKNIKESLFSLCNIKYFTIDFSGNVYFDNEYIGVNIRFVHQLQNFVFSLTGKELEFKL